MRCSLGWSKDPGPSADEEVPHYWQVYTSLFVYMVGYEQGIEVEQLHKGKTYQKR